MRLSPFAYQGSYANEYAMTEQAALIVCLYWNDRERAQRVLDILGGGEIISWQFGVHSWPPSYAVIRQESRLYVVLTGTMSVTQMLTHIIGSVPTPYQGVHSFAHPLWVVQATILQARVSEIIRASFDVTEVNIAGHSWGGAVSQLVAYGIDRQQSDIVVNLMTFGQPKAVTEGYTGPNPECYIRVVNSDDIVTNLPPVNPAVLAARVPILGPILGKLFGYIHWGRRVELTSRPDIIQGTIGEEEPFRTPNDITRTVSFEHSSITYLDRLILWNKRGRGKSPATDAGDLASALERTPTVQADNNGIALSQYTQGLPVVPNSPYRHDPAKPSDPEAMLPLESSLVSVSGITVRPDPSFTVQGGVSRRSTNIHGKGELIMSASGYWKITMIVNNGQHGTSTSVVWKGTQSIADAIDIGKALAYKRSSLLGNNAAAGPNVKSLASPNIEFLRVSDALNPRISQLIPLKVGDYFGYVGTTTNGADRFSTALTIRLKGVNIADNTTVSYSNHQFIGQPDVIVGNGSYSGGGTVITTGKTFDAFMKAYLDYLTTPGNLFGYMGLSVAEGKKDASDWTLNTKGRYQCVVTGHLYATGDKVRVSHCDVPLVNGVSEIVYVDPNTFYLKKNLGTTHPIPIHAKVQRIQKTDKSKPADFYLFQKADGGWVAPFGIKVSKKNLGREFTGVSFRKRNRRAE